MTEREGNYRPGVGIMVAKPQRLVFAGRRIQNSSHESWQLPQGGIDPGENTEIAVMRELEEETGLLPHHVRIVDSSDWLYYDIPAPYRHKLWNGQYVGQRQKWFLFEFLADDKAVKLENHGAPPEFDAWKWVPFDHIDAMAVSFKRDMYREIQAAFTESINSIAI